MFKALYAVLALQMLPHAVQANLAHAPANFAHPPANLGCVQAKLGLAQANLGLAQPNLGLTQPNFGCSQANFAPHRLDNLPGTLFLISPPLFDENNAHYQSGFLMCNDLQIPTGRLP
ncbi:MAG: hypothetical protein GTO45_00555 [Candidatus Aminicenantes bacterium]|nr:hypothetical protein [Candidatus Aminicenantes bacterium]NIM77253.1 hypothetical protein [Candidatus Aminicenantes bacterium]NIN16554.1 hypothetical protein [Candidatus Aminicenantes bacterium]NIN40412.1 hypothetical protein [Candidatus Aminicenantes bacterium]NIN83232.1 hypothetical protein [Candidatus Aminicenantes bacterium]